MTGPKKDNDKDKDNVKKNTLKEHLQRVILVTCGIWHTDYIPDNWEPGLMTIFVTRQLIVTLDSIRNSCDVLMFLGRFRAYLVFDTEQEFYYKWLSVFKYYDFLDQDISENF